MATSHSKTIQYFGLRCPESATLYICEGSDNEFIGCCTSDPCRDGSGICPSGDLRTTSFNPDKYNELKRQSCDDSRGSSIWWTCTDTQPPFMGCCDINPCGEGCSRKNLLPATLSKNKNNRQAFLNPENPTSKSASVATNTAPASSPPTSDNSGLGTGAIVGIAVGSAAFSIMLIAFLTRLCWRFRRKRRQTDEMVRSGESHRASETGQSPPMGYDNRKFFSNISCK